MKKEKRIKSRLEARNKKLKNFNMLEIGKEYTVIDVSRDSKYRGESVEYGRKNKMQVDKLISWGDNLTYIGSNNFFLIFKHREGFNITFNKNLEQTEIYCGRKKITKHKHIKKPANILMY